MVIQILDIGDKVEIQGGPWRGAKGTIVRRYHGQMVDVQIPKRIRDQFWPVRACTVRGYHLINMSQLRLLRPAKAQRKSLGTRISNKERG